MIGQLLTGRYLNLEKLGAGGFSETYLARDKYLPHHPLCVVKCLKLSPNNTLSLETARQLFETETRVLAQLGEHSQIPALFACSHEHDPAYLVQEYIDGENLGRWLERDRRLDAETAISLLSEVLPVLNYIHSHHVIHRDIKPSNLIRRQRDGKIVLIDFGAACLVPKHPQLDNNPPPIAIGTPGYMPNEQHLDKAEFNSDLYALGMSVIHLLTGVHPKQFQQDPISGELDWQVHLHDQLLEPKLIAILDRMVRIQASDRYQQAAEVLRDLQAFSTKHSWQRKLRSWQKKSRRMIKPVSAGLLVCLLGGKLVGGFGEQAEALVTQLGHLSHQATMPLTILNDQPLQVEIDQMLIAPHDRVLVTAGSDRVIRLWSLPKLSLLKSLSGQTDTVTALTMSRDGKRLISGAKDGTVRLWDTDSGQLLQTLRGHRGAIAAIILSPDQQTLVTGGKDGALRLWNAQTGILQRTLSIPKTEVTTVAYGATPDRLISASSDHQIQVWDLPSGRLHRTFAGHTAAIVSLQVVDSQTLFSFGEDRSLMWNLKREELAQVFPEDSAKSVLASMNDRRLVTVHDDGNIRVWTLRAGQLTMKNAGMLTQNSEVAMSPDQRYLASWSSDRRLRVWQMNASAVH